MLPDFLAKIKGWFTENQREFWIGAVVLLTAAGSFGLGRLTVLWPEPQPIQITQHQQAETQNSGVTQEAETATVGAARGVNFSIHNSATENGVVASKNGTVYHRPDCPGAKNIKPENLIRFETAEEAKRLGYRPAANCPGL